jgi:hypothetical protein
MQFTLICFAQKKIVFILGSKVNRMISILAIDSSITFLVLKIKTTVYAVNE